MFMRHSLDGPTAASPTLITTPPQTPATITAGQPTNDANAQGVTTSTTTTSPPPTDPNSQAPTIISTQQTSMSIAPPITPQLPQATDPKDSAEFQKLKTDMHAILAKSQVTVVEMVALHDDLQAIDKAATSAPSSTALQTFQNDLNSLDGTLPTDTQRAQLESDYTALVKSRGVTDQNLISKTISDAEAIIASSNITADDLATIAADRKAIQNNRGSSSADGTMGLGLDDPMSLGALLSGGDRMILKSDGGSPGGPLVVSNGGPMQAGSMMGDPMMMGGPMMLSRGFFGKGAFGGGGSGGHVFRGMI